MRVITSKAFRKFLGSSVGISLHLSKGFKRASLRKGPLVYQATFIRGLGGEEEDGTLKREEESLLAFPGRFIFGFYWRIWCGFSVGFYQGLLCPTSTCLLYIFSFSSSSSIPLFRKEDRGGGISSIFMNKCSTGSKSASCCCASCCCYCCCTSGSWGSGLLMLLEFWFRVLPGGTSLASAQRHHSTISMEGVPPQSKGVSDCDKICRGLLFATLSRLCHYPFFHLRLRHLQIGSKNPPIAHL